MDRLPLHFTGRIRAGKVRSSHKEVDIETASFSGTYSHRIVSAIILHVLFLKDLRGSRDNSLAKIVN